ncbi:rRNA maturation RNase YbeY [Brevibacillus laterosporus]|uniref:rRNA maturation RNase YbeY n=1 Tax=Brevibacillus laterosporus TaxID=1465 RepID=UPI000BCF3DDC|nr:rRNA maturation RNase YbeY [Brevibacillus laterosporus]PCN44410.1 rRNA maturation RNase YbeY [Brevibacillus laterosporus]
MLTIEIINEQDEEITQEHQQLIENCLQKAAQFEEIKGEVVITLVNNERIHELNRDYRGVDRPTDVLSFALNEEGEGDMEIFVEESEFDDYPNMLGDIIISIPRTKEQAQDYGHSFERELGFLAVHGFLHLIGYDHGTPEEEKDMFTRQENILQEVGLTR